MSDHNLAEALRRCTTGVQMPGEDFLRVSLESVQAGVEALAAHEAEQQAPPYTAPKLRALIDRVAEQQAGEAVAPYGYVYELWVEGALCGVSAVMGEQIGLDVPFGEAGVHHGGKVREVSLFTHPQQPLSEVEAASIFKAWREGPLWLHMTRGVEAAHKIGITKDTK